MWSGGVVAEQQFDHFVISRFSVVFDPDQPPMPREWLDFRLSIFTALACASLSRQIGDPTFRWLVFFDDRVDADFRATVEELAEGLFEPVFTHQLWQASMVQRAVAARSTAPFLITTRLDSDDAVAKTFISRVQAEFQQQDMLFINFNRGLQTDASGMIRRFDAPSNAFISLIEHRTPDVLPRTVYLDRFHVHARMYGPVKEIITAPMWLQTVHGSNIANHIRGTLIHPRHANRAMDIDLEYHRSINPITYARAKTSWTWQRLRTPGAIRDDLRGWAYRKQGTRTRPQLPHPNNPTP